MTDIFKSADWAREAEKEAAPHSRRTVIDTTTEPITVREMTPEECSRVFPDRPYQFDFTAGVRGADFFFGAPAGGSMKDASGD